MKIFDDWKKGLAEKAMDQMVADASVKHTSPEVSYWNQYPYDDNFKRLAWRHIERCARICYKSEPKDDTWEGTERFVNGLIKRGHTTPLAHAAIYLTEPIELCTNGQMKSDKYLYKWFTSNKYSNVLIKKDSEKTATAYITTNWRVYIENKEELDKRNIFSYETVASENHKKRFTFFVTGHQIAISREINRHTSAQICEQSTRYCNYTAEKFGGDVTFSIPYWWDADDVTEEQLLLVKRAMIVSNEIYKELVGSGLKPERARYVLPLGTATEEAITMFEDDWDWFISKRADRAAHEDVRPIAEEIKRQLEDLKKK